MLDIYIIIEYNIQQVNNCAEKTCYFDLACNIFFNYRIVNLFVFA